MHQIGPERVEAAMDRLWADAAPRPAITAMQRRTRFRPVPQQPTHIMRGWIMNPEFAKRVKAATAAIGVVLVSLGFVGLVQTLLPLMDRLGVLLVGSAILMVVGTALLGLGLLPAIKGMRQWTGSVSFFLSEITTKDIKILNMLIEDRFKPDFLAAKCQDPKSLNRHEHKAFSRHGEDGIVAEIFRRIGTTNRYFVEFWRLRWNRQQHAHVVMPGMDRPLDGRRCRCGRGPTIASGRTSRPGN